MDPTAMKYAFGKRISQIRIEHRYSQGKAANLSEVTRTYLSGIESGLRNPSLVTICRIAECFDMNVRDIFNEDFDLCVKIYMEHFAFPQ